MNYRHRWPTRYNTGNDTDTVIARKPFLKVGSQANFVAKYIMYSKADCVEHCVASEMTSWKQIEMGEYLHLDVG